MRHCFDADVPLLVVDVVAFTVLADEAVCLVDLVRERRGDEDLCEQGIGVERDGCQ